MGSVRPRWNVTYVDYDDANVNVLFVYPLFNQSIYCLKCSSLTIEMFSGHFWIITLSKIHITG